MPLRALPAFSDNYIWTLATAGGRALVVDPGDAAPVFAAANDGLQPAAVLLTHHHPDHAGGIADLHVRWPALPVFAPDDARIPDPATRVGDGDVIAIEGWRFDVIAVPGHTTSHIAFHGEGLLFCGDTLFSLGCGRLFEGTPAQMLASLDRLAALPGDTQVCSGHEYTLANAAFARQVDPDNPALDARAAQARAQRDAGHPTLPSTLAEELATNPFLRVDAPAIHDNVAQQLGRATHDRVDTFAALRAWKDGFVA